ncbi:hypothetical protein [Pseudoduganella sp. R-43]|uniref:hypothetical protein n=1 Tax=Pseudoduganella sp. R-43 TaxID=3404063 RepID=UPI003CE896F5
MSESRVVITADAARAVAEFQRFRTQAVGALEHVSSAGSKINGILGTIGVSLSVAAFTGWIKGAIDATDAASDLSQKTGIAIEDLAGLELAFQKGGMEAGDLEGSMAKLAKSIVDGSPAFEKLHIDTKNLNGSFKTNKEMLYELADRFAGMEDGVEKAALAQEIFGKSGASMIPMLNEGAEGLREMDEWAHKLGLSLSEDAVDKAGQFNDTLDLLKQGGQGVARGIAAELLPTLTRLTGQFLTTMTSGDRLAKTAQFIATSLKLLYSVGVGIVEVFSTVGKTLGAAGAQAVALMQGDFKTAAGIGRQWQEEVGNGWKASLASIEAAWSNTGDGAVEAMAKINSQSTEVTENAALVADAAKKAAKALEDENKALAEMAGLTGSFSKDWELLSALYGKGRISLEQLTKAQAELLAKQPAIKAAVEAEAAERKVLAEAIEQTAKAYDVAANARAKALAGLQAQKDENEQIGLSALDLAEFNAVRLESQALRAEENAEIAEGVDLTGAMSEQYRAEAAALRELANEQRSGARKKIAADEAKSATDEWKRAADNIDKSLTDALMRGFESGQSIAKNLIDTIKNMFKTLVLRPVVSAVVNPVAGTLGGMFGMAGPAMAASGGNGMGWISTGKNIYDAITSGFAGVGASMGAMVSTVGNFFGSSTISAFGAGMGMTASEAAAASAAYNGAGMAGLGSSVSAGSSVGAAAGAAAGIAGGVYGGRLVSGGYSAFGGSGNSTVNAGTAIGAVVGSIVPVVGTAIGGLVGGLVGGAVNRLFGHKPKEVTGQGITGQFGPDGLANGQTYTDWYQKGGTFRSSKRGREIGVIDAGLQKALGDGFSAIKAVTADFATTLGLSVDQVTGYTKSLNLALTKDEAKNKELLAKLFTDMGDELALRLVPNIANFAAEGESANVTLQRLAGNFKVVDGVLATFGVTSQAAFGAVGVASLQARERLLSLAGGAEALANQTSFFAQNFLSKAEQIAPMQKALNEQMNALGLGGVKTNDQFKQAVLGLVSSGALATETGAKTYATLMQLAPAFKAVSDAANEMLSERTELQKQLDELTLTSAEQLAKQRNALDESNRALFDQVQAAKDARAAQDAAKSSLGDFIGQMKSFKETARGLNGSLALSSLSLLTPEQQYAEARRQFERTRQLAAAGDATAQGNLGAVEQAFLELSQRINGGDAQYSSDLATVMRTNDELAQWAGNSADVAQASLDVLNSSDATLADIKATLAAIAQGGQFRPTVSSGDVGQVRSFAVDYAGFGAGNTTALVEEIKALRTSNEAMTKELKGLRADQAKQTGDLITAGAGAAQRAAVAVVDGVRDAVTDAAYVEAHSRRAVS